MLGVTTGATDGFEFVAVFEARMVEALVDGLIAGTGSVGGLVTIASAVDEPPVFKAP